MRIDAQYSFDLEREGDNKLWRYMSFAKFVALMQSGELYFTRADKFSDAREGTLPINEPILLTLRKITDDLLSHKGPNAAQDYLERFRRFLPTSSYVSCWYRSEYDSEGMWDRYGKSEGVAIVSTIRKLYESANDAGLLVAPEQVGYIDYESDIISPNTEMSDFSPRTYSYWKDISYSHEREFRLVHNPSMPPIDHSVTDKTSEEYWAPWDPATGKTLKVELDDLILEVIVSPWAAPWFIQLVKNFVLIAGLRAPVKTSRIIVH